jgi:hypothetical protein
METALPSEIFANIYRNAWHLIPEEYILNIWENALMLEHKVQNYWKSDYINHIRSSIDP